MAEKAKKKPTVWLVVDARTKSGAIIPDSMSSFKRVAHKSVSLKECRNFIKSHDEDTAKHMSITTQREVRSKKEDGDDYS